MQSAATKAWQYGPTLLQTPSPFAWVHLRQAASHVAPRTPCEKNCWSGSSIPQQSHQSSPGISHTSRSTGDLVCPLHHWHGYFLCHPKTFVRLQTIPEAGATRTPWCGRTQPRFSESCGKWRSLTISLVFSSVVPLPNHHPAISWGQLLLHHWIGWTAFGGHLGRHLVEPPQTLPPPRTPKKCKELQRSDMEWYDMIWYDMIWYDMIWWYDVI